MSIPGTLNGWREMDGFGMGKLGSVVREEGWKPKAGEKAVVEYQVNYKVPSVALTHSRGRRITPSDRADEPVIISGPVWI